MYPPAFDLRNPTAATFDPDYYNSFPMVPAYGFSLCQKLAIDSPDRAIRNPDSLANCALGKLSFNFAFKGGKSYSFDSTLGLYLHKNNWGHIGSYGIAVAISPSGEPNNT